MANTGRIAPCTCVNKGQDDLYGKHNRLHNYCQKLSKAAGGGDKYRCTVCGRIS